MIEWNFTGDAPIYTQIVHQFKLAIASGELTPGEKLAPVRELAMTAGVNPNTMQRALSELERDGLVFAQRTSGRFVTEDSALIESTKMELARTHVGTFLRAMDALGYPSWQIPALIDSFCKGEDANADSSM